MRRTVVITGVGLCTPVACDWAQLEESLLNEQAHGFKTLDTAYSKGIPAAVVTDPALDEPPTGLVTDRTVRMALLAARRALVDASVPDDPRWLETCWVGVGNGCGPTESNHAGYRQMMETGRLPALTLIRCLPSSTSAAVAMALGAKAGAQNYSCACASSTVAMGEAFRAIRHGYIDRAIVGGSESPTEESLLKTWESLRVLAPAGADPALACKPFDVDRKGIVLGEGAVFFVMESLASAQERGARILAQVLGFGTSADAHHWTEPHSEGQQAAMRRALQDADLKPEDIVAINAHGTATPVGDRVELDSLQSLFANLNTPVSSTKSLHGHMLGASGAMELACCLVSLQTQTVAPTRNLQQPEACGSLHLVSGQALQLPAPGPILSNSFAFGGSNACLVVGPIS